MANIELTYERQKKFKNTLAYFLNLIHFCTFRPSIQSNICKYPLVWQQMLLYLGKVQPCWQILD